MKQFTYVIQDKQGIHARPAGQLVKLAKPYTDTEVTITKGDKTVKAVQLMKLMGMGIKCGDEIIIAADGPAEDEAIDVMKQFIETNL